MYYKISFITSIIPNKSKNTFSFFLYRLAAPASPGLGIFSLLTVLCFKYNFSTNASSLSKAILVYRFSQIYLKYIENVGQNVMDK